MSRQSKHRRRARKRRRQEVKRRDREAEEQGLLLPSLFPNGPNKETRDPRLRWSQLSLRGGRTLSFRPTGVRVPLEFEDPSAEQALLLALAQRLHPDPEES